MQRTLYDEDHEAFRETVRRFVEKEVTPHYADWEHAGIAPRELFSAMGSLGFLGISIPEEFGGGGIADFRFNTVIQEEFALAGVGPAAIGPTLHTDVVLPYFLTLADEDQKRRWLPGIASGKMITAVAMTEPGIGSDLASMSTTATRAGDEYVLNGSKTFITNGINADLVVTAVKTDPAQRHRGMSLLVLERGMPGFERGRKLEKIGQHVQDTAELSFTDVRIPAANRLGAEGEGFRYLVQKLPQERLSLAVASLAAAQAALRWTIDYVRERKAFGQPVATFQNTKFRLAELATEIDLAQVWVDRCVLALNEGDLSVYDAAKAKYWCTEVQGRVVDACLQLHGGYGYITEYPISRAFVDARVTRIYGGTSEIMKELISRELGL